MKRARGRVWKLGDNISTDLLMPTFTMAGKMPQQEMAKYCLTAIRPEFASEARPGDIVVAGRNFGCGSSRAAQLNLLNLGIACLIVESMAPIFFRNCINLGLPALTQEGVTKLFEDGEEIEVDCRSGLVTRIATGETIQLEPIPEVLLEILEAGGLTSLLKKELGLDGQAKREDFASA